MTENQTSAIDDPGTYEAMSEPRPFDEVQRDLQSFYVAVRRERAKHRLADVVLVVSTPATTADGQHEGFARMHIGSTANTRRMLRRAEDSLISDVVNELRGKVELLLEQQTSLLAENESLRGKLAAKKGRKR